MTFKSFIMALVMAVVSAAFMPGQAQAQNAETTTLKIAIVNIEAIRGQSTAFQKAMAEIKTFSDGINAELDGEGEDLQKANEELGRKRTLLAPEAFAAERKKFEDRVATFQRKVQQRQKSLTETQANAMRQIDGKIIEIIAQYAEANNISLILPESVVVISAKTMNINDYVLKQLNQELPSVTVKAPGK